MYESFFGLTERPFSIAPDPQYLYMSARHKEAMAHLSYGLSQGGCFIVLTGEVGTGKTTLCRNLLMDLPDNVDVALILNANINETELLQTICDELKIEYQSDNSQKQLLDLINEYLLNTFADNRHTVLIIDEAQLLSRDVLEQIRLLTNLETTKSKLLQIILIGQPELSEMLTRNDLRQLTQRVTARYYLGALKPSEIEEYVNYRLGVAGCRQPLFTKQALARLHQITEGIPRKINVVADHALLSAYSQSQQTVGSNNIMQAKEEVFFDSDNGNSNSTKLKWGAFIAGLLLLNVLLWWFFIGKNNSDVVVLDRPTTVVAEDAGRTDESSSAQVNQPNSTVVNADPESVEQVSTNNADESLAEIEVASVPIEELSQSGSVVISEEFLDAEDGVVETVRNPDVLENVEIATQDIEPLTEPQFEPIVATAADVEIVADVAEPEIEPTVADAPTPQPVVREISPQTEFGRVLETSADRTGRIAAFRTLTGLWGADLPAQMLNPVCDEVANLGLRCLSVGTWPQVLRYNRPTTLVLDHNNQQHRVVVEKIDGDTAEVRVGDNIYRVDNEELQSRWNGSGIVVWRPTEAGYAFLQEGENNAAIANVRPHLNRALLKMQLPALASLSSSLYDQDLAQKVVSLQTRFGLISDAKIGNETYLLMNEIDSIRATPLLRQRVDPTGS